MDRAFVVQFDSNCPPERGPVGNASGRVEHVVSGRALRFRDSAELSLFMAEILLETAVHEGEAQ